MVIFKWQTEIHNLLNNSCVSKHMVLPKKKKNDNSNQTAICFCYSYYHLNAFYGKTHTVFWNLQTIRNNDNPSIAAFNKIGWALAAQLAKSAINFELCFLLYILDQCSNMRTC